MPHRAYVALAFDRAEGYDNLRLAVCVGNGRLGCDAICRGEPGLEVPGHTLTGDQGTRFGVCHGCDDLRLCVTPYRPGRTLQLYDVRVLPYVRVGIGAGQRDGNDSEQRERKGPPGVTGFVRMPHLNAHRLCALNQTPSAPRSTDLTRSRRNAASDATLAWDGAGLTGPTMICLNVTGEK